MTAKLRMAVVGAGVMGGHHCRVIANSERADLVLVVDPVESQGKAAADRFGAQWRPEIGALQGIEAVVVAAPTEHHTPLVAQALEAGIPVLVEKPVSGEFTESESLVAMSEKLQVPLMCGFVERFNPAVLTALPMVSQPLHMTAARHSPYANRIKTGVSWDLLIHDVDACLRFAGDEPIAVRCGMGQFHPSSDGGEDVAEAVIRFSGGAVAAVSASRIGQRKIRTISIAELDRTIEIDLLRRDVTAYRHVAHDQPAQGGYRQQTIIEIPELITSQEPLAAQFHHFMNIVDGKGDMDRERASILPAHRVIAQMMEETGGAN